MPGIPALRSLGQGDFEFDASVGYRVRTIIKSRRGHRRGGKKS